MKKAFIAVFVNGSLIVSAALGAASKPETLATPTMIGEESISTRSDEFGGSLSPDGKTIYFTRSVPRSYFYTMFVAHKRNGRWSKPEVLPFSGQSRDSDPVLSPDGKTLLFVSDRPIAGVDRHRYALYGCRWNGNGWDAPVLLGPRSMQDLSVYFGSLAANGNLYFTGRNIDNEDEIDIYLARFNNGKYAEPELLGGAGVNGNGIINVEAFVSSDERFLLIGAFGREGPGGSDLYVSYERQGQWTTPQLLTGGINTPAREYSPRLTPDGRNLIFTSETGFPEHPRHGVWTYKEFKRRSKSVLNGLGNIYIVPLRMVL